MRTVILFDRDDLDRLPWQVIVENYHHVLASQGSGSVRRKYQKIFSERERRFIAHFKFRMHRGASDFMFKDVGKIEIIKRAGRFFAKH